MAQLVAKYAAKKMLAGEMSKYADKAAAGPYVSLLHTLRMMRIAPVADPRVRILTMRRFLTPGSQAR